MGICVLTSKIRGMGGLVILVTMGFQGGVLKRILYFNDKYKTSFCCIHGDNGLVIFYAGNRGI